MKATRFLGFWAGITALAALVVLIVGAVLAMRLPLQDFLAFGMYVLAAGLLILIVSILMGIAHILLRIRFRNPYRFTRVRRNDLVAGRILVWVWAVSLIGIAVGAAVWLLGPGKDYISLLQLI